MIGKDVEPDQDLLGRRPKRGDGVRRLNRVPLLIAALMLLLILGAVTYTYQMRLAEIRRKAAEAETRPEPANLNHLFDDVPDGGLIPARQFPVAPMSKPRGPTQQPPPLPQPTEPYAEGWQRYAEERRRLIELRNQRLRQAVAAPTKIQGGTGHGLCKDRLRSRPARAHSQA